MRVWKWMPLALALVLATGVSASNPRGHELAAAQAAARADLARFAATLSDPGASERLSAARALVNLVSSQLIPLGEGLSYLETMSRDPDPEIARLAAETAFALRARAERLADGEHDTRSESVRQRVAAEREFEALARALLDPRSPERLGALRGIDQLASDSLISSEKASELLAWAESDQDPRIAREAGIMLARLEGRPIPANLVEKPAAAPLEKRAAPEDPVREQLSRLSDPDADIRYGALVQLMDVAGGSHASHRNEIVEAFQKALDDPDPRISSYAEFAVNGGLARETNAMHEVYVGQTSTAIEGEPQPPPTMEKTGAPMHQGHVDTYGVFIGIPERSAGGAQQPPAVFVATKGEHDGHVDQYGVFHGVAKDPPGSGEQQP